MCTGYQAISQKVEFLTDLASWRTGIRVYLLYMMSTYSEEVGPIEPRILALTFHIHNLKKGLNCSRPLNDQFGAGKTCSGD